MRLNTYRVLDLLFDNVKRILRRRHRETLPIGSDDLRLGADGDEIGWRREKAKQSCEETKKEKKKVEHSDGSRKWGLYSVGKTGQVFQDCGPDTAIR